MKIHLITTLLSGYAMLSQIRADELKPSIFFPTSPNWVYYDGECPESHYPIIIQGGLLEGDGATFRAIFAKVPSSDFQHIAVHGLSDRQYEKIQKEYSEQGYILIYHQELMGEGRFHQAIWVRRGAPDDKRPNGEQGGADQPATAPESKSEGKKKPVPESEGRSQ